MTTEKQRYSAYVHPSVGTTLFSQIMVSVGMVATALMLLEKLV